MAKRSYEYIEDNGGGLHLFVFNRAGKVAAGITNLEYAGAGEWNAVKDDLNKDAAATVRTWEGHMRDHDTDPAKFYAEINRSQYGYEVVCRDGKLYPDKMGRAASRYFGVSID